MQNWYVGDVGDYVKLAILRKLAPGRQLGIAWWLFPDERHKGDGRHLSYLDRPEDWRQFDPTLFDGLYKIREGRDRNICFLHPLLPVGTHYASEPVPSYFEKSNRRPMERLRWYQRVIKHLEGADLIFVDPDNGIAPDGFKLTQKKSGKSISFDEIRSLAQPDRPLIIYHHQTRRKGGHIDEIHYLAARLREETKLKVVGALRARPWSPRLFFILNADDLLIERAEAIARAWAPHISWHPCC